MQKIEAALRKGDGKTPFFTFADHASNALPASFEALGLPEDILGTHIAWDIGAAALTEALHSRLGGEAFYCQFSRLLVDPNRSLDRHDLVPPKSDHIPIPGNVSISYEEREQRINRFFEPYHTALDVALSERCTAHEDLFVTSIHSYTPRLIGEYHDRPWHVGVLWRHDEPSAHLFMDFLRAETDWEIGDNKPYDAHGFNYTVDRHIAPRQLPHLTLEVRQDLLGQEDQIEAMADILSEGIRLCHAHQARGGSPP